MSYDPRPSIKRKSLIVDNEYNLAKIELDLNKYDSALRYINTAIIKNPKPNYFFFRGQIYEKIGDLEKTYEDYKKAKELNKSDPVYWDTLAKICKELNKNEEALDNFFGVLVFDQIKEDPNQSANYYYEIASTYDALKNYEEARRFFEIAIDMDNRNAINYKYKGVDLIESDEFKGRLCKLLDGSFFYDVNSSKIFTEEELALTKMKNKDNPRNINDNIHSLEIEFEKKPNDLIICEQLGKLMKETNRFTEAIKYFEKCLEKQKKNKLIIIKLADCFLKVKNFEKAIKYSDMLIGLDPNLYKSYKIKSIAFFELNDMEKALENINKAIKIQPDNYSSKEFRKKIQYNLNSLIIEDSFDLTNLSSSVIPNEKISVEKLDSKEKILIETTEDKRIEPIKLESKNYQDKNPFCVEKKKDFMQVESNTKYEYMEKAEIYEKINIDEKPELNEMMPEEDQGIIEEDETNMNNLNEENEHSKNINIYENPLVEKDIINKGIINKNYNDTGAKENEETLKKEEQSKKEFSNDNQEKNICFAKIEEKENNGEEKKIKFKLSEEDKKIKTSSFKTLAYFLFFSTGVCCSYYLFRNYMKNMKQSFPSVKLFMQSKP